MAETKSELTIERLLEQAAPKAWNKVPANARPELLHAVQQITVSQTYSGPLPSPEDIKKYEEILPGSAERFLKMVEKQADHRMSLEKIVVPSQQEQGKRGQNYALYLVSALILSGVAMTFFGHDQVAVTIFRWTIASVAATFIVGKLQMLGSLRKKDKSGR